MAANRERSAFTAGRLRAKIQRVTDLIAFTDGGCRGNPGVGAWAFTLVDTRTRKALERSSGEIQTTNNRMELQAAIAALEAVKKVDARIVVFSDSKYLIGCCTKWLRGWKAAGWKRKGEPLKNLDLVQALDGLLAVRRVQFQWVAGHSGHVGNDHVDRLANEAMDRLQSQRDPMHERRFDWSGPLQ
jgi:ribonuclease HI